MLWGSGNGVYGTAEIYCNPSTDYLYSGSFYCGNWFRSTGSTGWYNESYAGGIHMSDSTYVRTYGSKIFYCDQYIIGESSVRSRIFYDYDNTGYYVDPNSYSYVYSLRAASYLASSGNIYTDSNYGYGLVGTYSASRYQGVFAMSDSYKLAADGTTTGNLYGIAWSHPNAGGVAGNLNTHGALIMENGTFRSEEHTSELQSH